MSPMITNTTDYGKAPAVVRNDIKVACNEMMFYQYMPISMPGDGGWHVEPRLDCFDQLITYAFEDFADVFGYRALREHYAYITAKSLYVKPGQPFNRPGWHSDGFMTNDINYIWSDQSPTEFAVQLFKISMDDQVSMVDMENQARHIWSYPNNTLLRLDQFNIHRVGLSNYEGVRTFVKISFSKDKYDLIGNTKNYLLNYNWEMRPRGSSRNIPQKLI